MFQSPDSADFLKRKTQRLLVVDDEPTLRLGFSYALTNASTQVDAAATGRQALELSAARDYQAIILDLRMPDIDGIGVIQALRSIGSNVPIVLCTAALTPASALQAMQQGVVDYLLKPIRPPELRGVVDFILNPHHSCFAGGMHFARQGDFNKAQECLDQENQPTPASIAWCQIFKLLHLRENPSETFLLEEKIRQHLNTLAYRLPSSP
ncbi:MAG: response regulator [Luteolibacter sp.]